MNIHADGFRAVSLAREIARAHAVDLDRAVAAGAAAFNAAPDKVLPYVERALAACDAAREERERQPTGIRRR